MISYSIIIILKMLFEFLQLILSDNYVIITYVMDEKALLIGFNDSIKLNIFLDYKNNDEIYLQFGTEYKFTRQEFQALISFMRTVGQVVTPEKVERSKPGVISPKSMAQTGFVMLQENGYLKIEYKGFIKTLAQPTYFDFTRELEIAAQGLDRYDKIKEMTPEARAAMGIDEAGRPLVVKDTMYTIRLLGYAFAVMLMLLDMVLLVAAIFNPMLLFPVAIIALSIILAYLLLPVSEKKALSMFLFNFRQFMEKDFWSIADSLPISRKTIEMFIVLLIVMTIMTAYFSKSIPMILKWGKGLYAEAPAEATDNEDILKALTISRGSGVYYDAEKKCTAFANFYKSFFDAIMSSRVTLKKTSAVTSVGSNNASLMHEIEGEILTGGSVANVQEFVARVQRHKAVIEVKTEPIVNGVSFKIRCLFGHGTTSYFKRMKLYKTTKKLLGDVTRKNLYMIIGNVPMSSGGMVVVPKRDRVIFEYSYNTVVKKFDQIVTFLTSMEAEQHCLQIVVDELARTTAGDYELRIRVVFVGAK